MKKLKIFSVLVASCLFLQLFTLQAFAFDLSSDNMATLTVLCEDTSVDLANIKVDIYSAQLAYSDEINGYYQYDETFVYTESLSTNGTLSFVKPSDACSITIRLDSLPENYGVTEHTHFFFSDSDAYTIRLEQIREVNIMERDGQVFPVFTGSNSDIVYTNAVITKADDSSYEVTNDEITILSNYLVEYGGLTEHLAYERAYVFFNDAEKLTILYENGFISESTYIESLANWLLESEENRVHSEKYKQILHDYVAENKNKSIHSDVLDAYTTISNDQIALFTVSADNYVYSESGRFRVYYPSDSYLEAAEIIAEHFDDINYMFCTTFGFVQPDCAIDTNGSSIRYTHYRVIIEDIDAGADTPFSSINPGMSHIRVDVSTADILVNAYNNPSNESLQYINGYLSHEYMHAILYAYGIPYNTTEQVWMHESLAVLAGCLYESQTVSTLNDRTGQYLNATYNYMPNMPSPYGGILFPLYVYEECGGANTLKAILEAYATNGNPLSAYDAGLQSASTATLASAFARHAAFNSDTTYFYDLIESNMNFPSSSISNSYSSYPAPSVTNYLAKLGYSTVAYSPASTTDTTITVTVDFTTTSGPALYSVLKNLNGSQTMQVHNLGSSGRCTIVKFGFSPSSYQSLLIIPSNTNTSGYGMNCVISATLS